MNSVSWFIYLADILSGVQVLFGLFGTIGLIASVIAFTSSFYYETETVYRDYRDPKSEDYNIITYPLESIRPWAIFGMLITLIWMFLAICIPSKDTRYMIAASQVGEQVIQLEEVQKLGGDVGGLASDTIELLRQNIQEQLTEKPVQAD